MSKPKYANQRDANHSEIQEYLEANGVEVVDCSKAGELPDMLVFFPKNVQRGRAGWLEAKVLRGAKFTWKQLNFIAGTSTPVCIVTDKESALSFAIAGEGYVTHSQKNRLAVFLQSADKKKLYTPKQVSEAMNLAR